MDKRIEAVIAAMKEHYAARIVKKYPVGTVYGRLTIVGYEQADDGWGVRCSCSCGGYKLVRNPNQLRRGVVASCGCLWRESRVKIGRKIPRKRLAPGQAAFNQLFYVYTKNAFDRGIGFEITAEQFKRLVTQNCAYCGAPPVSSVCHARYNGKFDSNGLDRVDPNGNYTVDNVVTSCKSCNYAKRGMSHTEFMVWLDRIIAHRLKS